MTAMIKSLDLARLGPVATWPDMASMERMAAVAYAAIRELGQTCGEVNRPTWQIAPESIKGNYRMAVGFAQSGLEPRQAHEAWLDRRESEGWRWGPEYDGAKRAHPMLRAWSELTPVQQFQYALLAGVVRAFATANGR
jgi:hypothetical protein